MTPTGPYTSSARLDASRSPRDFVPDGDLTKSAWKGARWLEFDNDMNGRRHYPEAATRIAALWTPAYLYAAFKSKYTTLNVYEGENPSKERWELWNRDVVEVFVNPQPERVNHYYEFEVAPNNQWIDLEIDKDKTPFNNAAWDSHFEHATRVDPRDHVWSAEMRIPVASMGAKAIAAGSEWRINFYRADGPGPDPQRRFLAWSTIAEGTTFHVPTRFGVIRFVK